MTHKTSHAERVLLDACRNFNGLLKAFIKDPKSGRNAHLAAQVLFDMRRLENALADCTMRRTENTQADIQPIDHEILP